MIVYYSRDDLSYDVICLVELKKNKAHEKEAITQIIDTYKRIKQKFNCRYGKEIRWLAYIHYPNSGASQINEKEKKSLLKIFDHWDCSKENDIGTFLRGYAR